MLINIKCEICNEVWVIDSYGNATCPKCGQKYIYDNDCYRIELTEEQRCILRNNKKPG
jgi:predicted RNA-binding Zn-ribbon protein involved in translation (DUF1610 family)